MTPKAKPKWTCPRCGQDLIIQDIDEQNGVEIGQCKSHHVYGRDMENQHGRSQDNNQVSDMRVVGHQGARPKVQCR